jgi:hypothetical protein
MHKGNIQKKEKAHSPPEVVLAISFISPNPATTRGSSFIHRNRKKSSKSISDQDTLSRLTTPPWTQLRQVETDWPCRT